MPCSGSGWLGRKNWDHLILCLSYWWASLHHWLLLTPLFSVPSSAEKVKRLKKHHKRNLLFSSWLSSSCFFFFFQRPRGACGPPFCYSLLSPLSLSLWSSPTKKMCGIFCPPTSMSVSLSLPKSHSVLFKGILNHHHPRDPSPFLTCVIRRRSATCVTIPDAPLILPTRWPTRFKPFFWR